MICCRFLKKNKKIFLSKTKNTPLPPEVERADPEVLFPVSVVPFEEVPFLDLVAFDVLFFDVVPADSVLADEVLADVVFRDAVCSFADAVGRRVDGETFPDLRDEAAALSVSLCVFESILIDCCSAVRILASLWPLAVLVLAELATLLAGPREVADAEGGGP